MSRECAGRKGLPTPDLDPVHRPLGPFAPLVARLLPSSAGPDAARLILARTVRGLSDGFVSVLLAAYLRDAGFSPVEISAIVTGTLLGSAALTLGIGLFGYEISRRTVLFGAVGLMAGTGIGFASVTAFWPLLAIAVVGTLNPSNGDVSVFLPTEQALLSETVEARDRTAIFARYNLGGLFAAAIGALGAGLPVAAARALGWDLVQAERLSFLLYAGTGLVLAGIYAGLRVDTTVAGLRSGAPLRKARRTVYRLTALFCLDSFGGGFVVQSLLALWLFERFDLPVAQVGAVFFGAGLLAATSQLASPWLAGRIGLIRTMVYTHLPSNGLLILAALMPTAPLAVACLLLRMMLSQMDVPARQSYVMAVVPPEERAAAASVTNVPRSLAAAFAPLLAGAMLEASSFGWPLICAGVLKSAYDLLLLWQFRAHPAPEEAMARASA